MPTTALATLLLTFTAGTPVLANTPQANSDRITAGAGRVGPLDLRSDDGLPGTRNGPAVPVDTLAGSTVFAGERVLGVGGSAAVAARPGPLAVEVEYSHLAMYERDTRPGYHGNRSIGDIDRIGIAGRLDIGELGGHLVGPHSKLVFWLEAGVGAQCGRRESGEGLRQNDRIAGFD
ncbi:MAG: hypothetical protein MJE77_45315 [Proteobacteria bacterium]|nr:hypothetical protein [Pseudomonadota bacterium]